MVTVFTNSGGVSGNGFTGILIEVQPDHIKLITRLPGSPNQFGRPCPNHCRLGASTVIAISHITAVAFTEPF